MVSSPVVLFLVVVNAHTEYTHSFSLFAKKCRQDFVYTLYLQPHGNVYPFTFEETPGYTVPAAGLTSGPWYDLHIIRYHNMFAAGKHILYCISVETFDVSSCTEFEIGVWA